MRNAHKPASHLSAQCSVDSRPTADTTRLDCVGRGPTVIGETSPQFPRLPWLWAEDYVHCVQKETQLALPLDVIPPLLGRFWRIYASL